MRWRSVQKGRLAMFKTYSVTCLVVSIFLSVGFCTAALGRTIYVDDDVVGANDGSSWENAYTFLQEALADANSAEKPVEIRVAQGTYRPNEGLLAIPEFDWRTSTFQLINGVILKGGHAGFGEPDPNALDISEYETILSGDLNGDDAEVMDPRDLLTELSRDENSLHVVTGSSTDASAVLDGFTITGGNANGAQYPDYFGGGMFNFYGSPTVARCIFTGNSANGNGGGMCNWISCWPKLTNCMFVHNAANSNGGGMNNEESSPHLRDCAFSGNMAGENGGAMAINNGSSPTLTNCTFSENSADSHGGAMEIWSDSSPTLTDCTFTGNSTLTVGGGIDIGDNSNPTLTNCTFNANSANSGGGIYNDDSNPSLTNCTFIGNSAFFEGGGILTWNYSKPSNLILSNCTFAGNSAHDGKALAFDSYQQKYPSIHKLINCILWDGGNEIWNNDNSAIMITYSDIRGDWPGEGNIDVDPQFFESGGWVDVNDPNIAVEPNDPNAVWVDGDYHLKSEAGRWDPNSESWVVDDDTSPCIDAGDPNGPVGDEPDPNGGIINMGAYGGTLEASMSHVEQIVYIQWLGHSTVKIWTEDHVIYVDPERVPQSLHDADLVCVTHTHGDHYSPSDIAKVSNAQTQFIGPPDMIQRHGDGQIIAPGQTIQLNGVSVTGVRAYNTNKSYHPRSNNWVGYVVEIASKRIYLAGDTDLIDEMKALQDIDVAFLPAGGTYTMNAAEAAEATGYIRPDLAIPYHWGQIVGTLSDAETFVRLAESAAQVMTVNETISSDNWPE